MSPDDMTPDEVDRFGESAAGTAVRWCGQLADAATAIGAAGGGGGTNDIQRGLIARALGLPR